MEKQLSSATRQNRRATAMATQHRVARSVSEAFVGRTLKVLVEGEASAKELQKANVSSWEHGLIRGTDSGTSALGSRGKY